MSDNSGAPRSKGHRHSALLLLAVLLIGLVFFVEVWAMVLVPMLPVTLSKTADVIQHAFLLFALLFPGLYFLVFRPLMMSIEKREQTEADLEQSVSLLRATLDSTTDGILTVDKEGRIISFNQRFTEMWNLPRSIAESGDDEGALAHVLDQLLDPDSFIAKVHDLYSHPEMDSFDVIEFKDGRVFERYSLPQRMKNSIVGRVWSFRDVTERKRIDDELKHRDETLQRFRMAMDATADAIYLVDRTTMRFIDLNEAACRMREQSREELLALGPHGVLSQSREALEHSYDALIARGGESEQVEIQRRRRDGTQVTIEISRRAQRLSEGWVIVTTARDITARKQDEQAVRESMEKLRLFADNVPAMTVVWDENLRCRFANKVFSKFFGFAVDDILGKHVSEVLGEDAYRESEGHFVRVLQGQPVTYQRTHKIANGEARYIEVKLLPHIGDQGKLLGCFAVTTDITEHKLAEERIQRVAHHDSLTGLPNRLLFNDRLQQTISLAKRDSRQFALLYIDLDKFKPVNDTFGHAAGDELLQAVAARIRNEVRESDTVARLGGDEFALILPDSRREQAETVARKVISTVAVPFQLGSGNPPVHIGASIGIAVYPSDGDDAVVLASASDTAMYSAKQVGGSFRFAEA